jgi:hypothetical protein
MQLVSDAFCFGEELHLIVDIHELVSELWNLLSGSRREGFEPLCRGHGGMVEFGCKLGLLVYLY